MQRPRVGRDQVLRRGVRYFEEENHEEERGEGGRGLPGEVVWAKLSGMDLTLSSENQLPAWASGI